MEIKEMNILFCYEGNKYTWNESEKKTALSTTQKRNIIARQPIQTDQRAQEGK